MFLKHIMHSQNNSFERNISVHFCWLGPVFCLLRIVRFLLLREIHLARCIWWNPEWIFSKDRHTVPGQYASANTPPWSRAAARNLPNGCENGDKLSDRFRSFVSQNSQIPCSVKGWIICGMETQWDKSVEPATSENPTNPAKRRHFFVLRCCLAMAEGSWDV